MARYHELALRDRRKIFPSYWSRVERRRARPFDLHDSRRPVAWPERHHHVHLWTKPGSCSSRKSLLLLGLFTYTKLTIFQTGALAFYFLVIGHVSRAWIMIGLSIRLALALGLHLRNEDPSLDEAKRETLIRTWWCLHSIECLVSSITGRPPVIGNEDCTVSLPHLPVTRDKSAFRQSSRTRTRYSSPQTTTSSIDSDPRRGSTDESNYLRTYIDLTLISQKVLFSLYSPRTATQSWQVRATKNPFIKFCAQYMILCPSILLTFDYSTSKTGFHSCSVS
jgi:hypothetical protein